MTPVMNPIVNGNLYKICLKTMKIKKPLKRNKPIEFDNPSDK